MRYWLCRPCLEFSFDILFAGFGPGVVGVPFVSTVVTASVATVVVYSNLRTADLLSWAGGRIAAAVVVLFPCVWCGAFPWAPCYIHEKVYIINCILLLPFCLLQLAAQSRYIATLLVYLFATRFYHTSLNSYMLRLKVSEWASSVNYTKLAAAFCGVQWKIAHSIMRHAHLISLKTLSARFWGWRVLFYVLDKILRLQMLDWEG